MSIILLEIRQKNKLQQYANMFKIAIIEDDHAIASMYEFKLNNAGYSVRMAHNGQLGLQLVEAFAPDLILLDLRMPVMSGDEMLEQMRATEWGGKPRVIVLTNISKDEAPHNLRFLNVDRYIVKAHHTPAQVVSIIEDVLA
jgi:DNA-binding response OmpR family regulator